MKTRLLILLAVIVVLSGLVWGGRRISQVAARGTRTEIPTTQVKKGRVTMVVSARGELQGGNSEVLTAPMSGGGDMAITYLREPGELIKSGDVVIQFDAAQQEFNLREAE